MAEQGSPDTATVTASLLRLVADSVPALMAYYEVDTLRCRFANRRYAQYNGWTPQTILGKTVREVIGPQAWEMIEPQVRNVLAGGEEHYVRTQTLPDGTERVIEVDLLPHFDDDGHQLGAFVLINDITDRWVAQRHIRESEERLRKFMQASSEGILFHRDGVFVDANDALLRLTGYAIGDLIGRQTIGFVCPEWRAQVAQRIQALDEEPYEAEIFHRDGRRIPVELEGRYMWQQDDGHRMVVVRDISARKAAQQRIEFLALHDPLTELPNRLHLNQFLPHTLAQARRQRQGVAVMFVDLDGFKPVNDRLGHEAGDALLCSVSRRLRAAVRESDLVARLGGDEFLVILTDVGSPNDVVRVAEAILASTCAPIVWRGQSLEVRMSVGVSLFPEHGSSPHELIRHADAAMYRAKTGGGGCYRIAGHPSPEPPR